MNERVLVLEGDCLAVMDTLSENSVDAVVTDPPYHLTSIVKRYSSASPAKTGERNEKFAAQRLSKGFMGKSWDGGDVAFRALTWEKVFRVMKPGAFLCAFSATRTYHRMVCAIEDAGFTIRDQLDWLYGSGFPKSHDIAKAIDKMEGHWRGRAGAPISSNVAMSAANYERTDKGAPVTAAAAWDGYGTALKPAHEPIVLAQKPISEKTIVANVLRWGTGALNIAGCRVDVTEDGGRPARGGHAARPEDNASSYDLGSGFAQGETQLGRWPANVLHDGGDDVEAEFAAFDLGDPAGSPSRFFYSAKADAEDRLGSSHPTVKPIDLMAWLVRLVTPPAGIVLDPFSGTGTTAQAAMREGRRAIAIEREGQYVADIKRRIAHVEGADTPLFGGANDNLPDLQGGRKVYGAFARDT